ncbi:MAG: hypothetical protein J6S85_25055 [Methanobrevibacter sp.]|nr:hypothetical protein [Methanobrevibacter sp.]
MEEIKNENIDEKDETNEVKVNVNVATQDMIDAMNKINNTIKHMNDAIEHVECDNSINIDRGSFTTRLVDSSNNKLTDYELCKRVLYNIDNDKNQQVKIHPDFVEFMRQFVTHVDSGGSATEFKINNIFRQFDLSKFSI